MKTIKTWLGSILFVILMSSFSGCTTNDSKIKVGILQLISHSALDASKDGIIEAFKKEGWGKDKVSFQIQNPQGDTGTMSNMAKTLLRNNDIVIAIATPAAVSLVNEAKDANIKKPILFTAVTDPIAANLINSNEEPGGNVTGSNDMNPVAEQIQLAKELLPQVQKIGIVYTSSEVNSQIQVNLALEKAKDLNIKVEISAISSVNEIQQAVTSLITNKQIDLLYVPTDNTLASAMEVITSITQQHKIPTICGEASLVEKGGIITLGIDYKKLGILTGEMAIKILKEEMTPSTFPVQSLTEFDLIINKKLADKINLTIPTSLLERAKRVIE